MEYINIEEASKRWGLSIRRIQDLCKLGKVQGAKKFGANWMVPSDAQRPLDGRSKTARQSSASVRPLIRKSPFLDMTDLYNTPGSADEVISSLSHHPEAQELFSAEIAYSRGQIDKVYTHARHILDQHSGFYAMLSGGMLLALVAMWNGDTELWKMAKKHIYEAPWKDENDRDIIALSIAATDLSIRNTDDFPLWFSVGRFDRLPADSHPAARIYYIKHLLIYAQQLASGHSSLEDAPSRSLLKALPFVIEPMIAQAVVERTVMAEIYLRLLCSVAYHQTGDKTNASFHLDKAITLCLADRLYGPLVEHRRQLGLFLDERLLLISPESVKKVKDLHKILHEGWVALHNSIMENNISSSLSDREREVARLVAFGLSDEQIASHLHITKASVKSMIQMARNKTGIKSREDFRAYI